ncbi:MAG: hypothetical protein ACKO96_05590 [Flammeovirgaceae bacterium]
MNLNSENNDQSEAEAERHEAVHQGSQTMMTDYSWVDNDVLIALEVERHTEDLE